MLVHFLHDALAFLATESIQSGVQVSSLGTADIVVSLIFTAIFVALGLWLVRPAKRPEILALWGEKWSGEAAPEAPLPDIAE